MQKTTVIALIALAALTGCTHQLSLMSRTSGTMGSGVAKEAGKTVSIDLNGKTYRGTYSFSRGGSYSLSNATAFSGANRATAHANGMSIDASGNGNVLARSDDGGGLRCVFNYGGMSGGGNGVCLDDAGQAYDMQIN